MNWFNALVLSVLATSSFADPVSAPKTPPFVTSMYASVGGGFFKGVFQADYVQSVDDIMVERGSFNNYYNSDYGQIALGTTSQIGTLNFDHQFVVTIMGGAKQFTSIRTSDGVLGSRWKFHQKVDFGYDFMPKMYLLPRLSAFGILGVHIAQFSYVKVPFTDDTAFNDEAYQAGFNLGVGLLYNINPMFSVGVKFQHLQYLPHRTSGSNVSTGLIDTQKATPAYNLFGVELRYQFS